MLLSNRRLVAHIAGRILSASVHKTELEPIRGSRRVTRDRLSAATPPVSPERDKEENCRTMPTRCEAAQREAWFFRPMHQMALPVRRNIRPLPRAGEMKRENAAQVSLPRRACASVWRCRVSPRRPSRFPPTRRHGPDRRLPRSISPARRAAASARPDAPVRWTPRGS